MTLIGPRKPVTILLQFWPTTQLVLVGKQEDQENKRPKVGLRAAHRKAIILR